MNELQIRPAKETDKDAVFTFCATTWHDGDYIIDVWDEWFGYPHSDLLVGLVDDQPVGLVHVTVRDGSGWLEGMRVAPGLRGHGLAHQLLRGGIDVARTRGATVLRLLTEQGNRAMVHLLPQHGFEVCFSAAWYHAPATMHGEALSVTRVSDANAAWAALNQSSLLTETGGLYADGWSFVSWTRARLDEYVARGEVVHVVDAGYAIVIPDGESDQPAIALAAGDMAALLQALRAHSVARAYGDICLFLPLDGPTAQLAQAAGYQPRPHRFGIWALGL